MPRDRHQDDDWFVCSCCGAKLRGGAAFCRECGASDDSGWGDKTDDYGDDDFDYDDYIRREFPEHAPAGTRYPLKKVLVVVIVLLLCVGLLLWIL